MAAVGNINNLSRAQLELLRELYPVLVVEADGRMLFFTSRAAAAAHAGEGYASNGAASTAPSKKERMALIKGAKVRAKQGRPLAPPTAGSVTRPFYGDRERRHAHAALIALAPLADGAKHFAEDLAAKLDLAGPRGLASVAGTIRKGLQYTEHKESAVYQRMRQEDGRRYWIRRGSFAAAVAELEAIGKGGGS